MYSTEAAVTSCPPHENIPIDYSLLTGDNHSLLGGRQWELLQQNWLQIDSAYFHGDTINYSLIGSEALNSIRTRKQKADVCRPSQVQRQTGNGNRGQCTMFACFSVRVP
jgi:hypothetical protein